MKGGGEVLITISNVFSWLAPNCTWYTFSWLVLQRNRRGDAPPQRLTRSCYLDLRRPGCRFMGVSHRHGFSIATGVAMWIETKCRLGL